MQSNAPQTADGEAARFAKIVASVKDMAERNSMRSRAHSIESDAVLQAELARLESLVPKTRARPEIDELIAAMPAMPMTAKLVHSALSGGFCDVSFLRQETGPSYPMFRNPALPFHSDIPAAGLPCLESISRELAAAFHPAVPSPEEWGTRYWNHKLRFEFSEGAEALTIRMQDSPDGVFIARATFSQTPSSPAGRAEEQRRESASKAIDEHRRRRDQALFDERERALAALGPERPLMEKTFEALLTGDAQALNACLAQGFDPGWTLPSAPGHHSEEWLPPLNAAVLGGSSDCLRLLLPLCDPDSIDGCCETPLAKAIRRGQPALASILAPVSLLSSSDENGKTPLFSAAWHGDIEAARLLLDCGAHPDGPCYDPGCDFSPEPWRTPLWIAAQEGYGEICRLLVGAGADPRRTSPEGETAASHSCRLEEADIAFLDAAALALDEKDRLGNATRGAGCLAQASRI